MKVSKLIIILSIIVMATTIKAITNNTPPSTPTNPVPPDGATGVNINIILSWNCTDPDGDTLTYDVYFDTQSPPKQVATGLMVSQYNPGILEYNTTYYWMVAAKDGQSINQSELWSFTTARETDQQQTEYTAASSIHPEAQSFVPTYDTLTYIDLLVDRIGNTSDDTGSGNITVSIMDGLNGSVVGSCTESASYITYHPFWQMDLEWYSFDFNPVLHLIPQHTYYIVIDYSCNNCSIIWAYQSGNPYQKGMQYRYNSTSATWEDYPDWDFAFKTHGYNNFGTGGSSNGGNGNGNNNGTGGGWFTWKLPFSWFAIFAIIFVAMIGIATSAFFLKPESIKALGYAPAAGSLLITIFIAVAIFMYYSHMAWYWIIADIAVAIFILFITIKAMITRKGKRYLRRLL